MKFTAVIALATAVVGITAAPAPEANVEARTSGIQCCKKDGKWHYGWNGATPAQEFTCKTTGVINILNCISVLNGNSVSVPISVILPPLVKREVEEREVEERTSGIQCCKKDGKWHYGWNGATPSQEFTCKTTGVLNVLNCVSLLNGNSVSVPVSIILPPLAKREAEAEAAEVEARSAQTDVKCCKKDGKWYYGWNGATPSQEYTCKTVGILNLLNCVSILNGNTVQVPISIIL